MSFSSQAVVVALPGLDHGSAEPRFHTYIAISHIISPKNETKNWEQHPYIIFHWSECRSSFYVSPSRNQLCMRPETTCCCSLVLFLVDYVVLGFSIHLLPSAHVAPSITRIPKKS